MRADKYKKRWPKVIRIILTFFLLGILVYGISVFVSLHYAWNSTHKPLDDSAKVKNNQPFSVLLLGVDKRKNDVGRSDTIILITVNPKNESMEMLSIPRDTLTEIVGKGTKDKINHAYAFGGVPMAVKTVEKFSGIPIDYYVEMNMEGFKEIVNAVGGITVNNTLDFTYDSHHFPKGQISLNGAEALAYSRMRHEDPQGDFGRQKRQRQVIEGIIKKGASLSSIWNYGSIFKSLGHNLETNLTLGQIVNIQKNYGKARKNIEQIALNGSGTNLSGIYYFVVPDDEKKRIQEKLQNHLEIQ
jgi:LCP family protein required for cell wall assembly